MKNKQQELTREYQRLFEKKAALEEKIAVIDVELYGVFRELANVGNKKAKSPIEKW